MRRERWTSRPCTAKSVSIKSAKRRPGGCGAKAIEITSGDLRGVSESRLKGPRGALTVAQKSAEGKVGGGDQVTERPNGVPSQEGKWRGEEEQRPRSEKRPENQ